MVIEYVLAESILPPRPFVRSQDSRPKLVPLFFSRVGRGVKGLLVGGKKSKVTPFRCKPKDDALVLNCEASDHDF